ncbi:MAG: hypothetical protein ABS951_05445 [Solibacillus sp.]
MLSKEQIDTLLQEKRNTPVATEAERGLLKHYLAQQTGEETRELMAKFNDRDVLVSDEDEGFISFTWSLKQCSVYELSDIYFATIPKK